MDSLFDKIAKDASSVQQGILGQDYNYPKMIKKPSEMGVGDKGSFKQLTKNIAGIINYNTLLVSGNSKASKAKGGGPLGGRYFLQTLGKCTDVNERNPEKQKKPRSMYVSNVPSGNIPFISDMAGMNFKMLRGLIPGLASNVDAVNPLALFAAFKQKPQPYCTEISLPEVKDNGKKPKRKRGYVPLNELRELASNDDDLAKIINPVLRKADKSVAKMEAQQEGFMGLEEDHFSNVYLSSVSLVFFYILFCLYKKLLR